MLSIWSRGSIRIQTTRQIYSRNTSSPLRFVQSASRSNASSQATSPSPTVGNAGYQWLPWAIAVIATTSATIISLRSSFQPQSQTLAEHDISAAWRSPTASTLPIGEPGVVSYDISAPNVRAAIEEFCQLLGSENVDLSHSERKTRSSTAWSPAPRAEDVPSVIVYPHSTADVSGIARICHRRRIPMMAFSGGTSLEGTLAAQNTEVCLDFNRHMNKVLAVRKDDMDITVQPAVGYLDLNQQLAEQSLFFPPDPGPGAQIGGMIAMGCSGTNAYRYGTMKDWVLGLEVVLADGTIINTRARPRKSSAGYDLTRLFVGSEGTLGFVTKAHLKITRAPDNLTVAVAQFPSVHDAVRMAVRVVQSGHQLEAMELLDAWTMGAINTGGFCTTVWEEKPTLFLKLAGPSKEDVQKLAQVVGNISKNCKSTLFHLAADESEGSEIWQARKTALWALLANKEHPNDGFLSADACVPISRLGDTIAKSQEIIEKYGLVGSNLGHVGDGNFHTSVLYKPSDKEKAKRLISDVQDLGISMDGTVSGEHGIGLNYRDKVVDELGKDTVDAMRQIKVALDPLCLLNPGKMIRLVRESEDE